MPTTTGKGRSLRSAMTAAARPRAGQRNVPMSRLHVTVAARRMHARTAATSVRCCTYEQVQQHCGLATSQTCMQRINAQMPNPWGARSPRMRRIKLGLAVVVPRPCTPPHPVPHTHMHATGATDALPPPSLLPLPRAWCLPTQAASLAPTPPPPHPRGRHTLRSSPIPAEELSSSFQLAMDVPRPMKKQPVPSVWLAFTCAREGRRTAAPSASNAAV